MELPIVNSILRGELRPNIFFKYNDVAEIKQLERNARRLQVNSGLIDLELKIHHLLSDIVDVKKHYLEDKKTRDAAVNARKIGIIDSEEYTCFDKEVIIRDVIHDVQLSSPELRLYDQLLKAEQTRTRMAFHYLCRAFKCDRDLRTELRKTLKYIVKECNEAARWKEHYDVMILIDAHLTCLYFSLFKTYESILTGSDVDFGFEDFVYEWRGEDPTPEELSEYKRQCDVRKDIDEPIIPEVELSSQQKMNNRPKDIADKFLDEVERFNFLGMPKIKALKDENKIHSFLLNMLKDVSYACAMLEFLEFITWIQNNYDSNFTKGQYDALCSKAIMNKNNGASFHNVRMSLKADNSAAKTYHAYKYVNIVETDYQNILVS